MRSFIPFTFVAGALAASSAPPAAASATTTAWENRYTATAVSDVLAAAATAPVRSSVSHVRGRAFQRFVNVWLENTDYEMAIKDPNLLALAKKGITMTNYFGVTHPSEPNYVASIAGDHFGMQNDNFNQVDGKIATLIDLLEDKGISWAHYQEDLPHAGFEGMAWINHLTGQNNYVRKHCPAVIFNSVAGNPDRLPYIKNFTSFYQDLADDKLPQWMFITPNMLNDGHDTSVTTAGEFARSFLEPLLHDRRFNKDTLIQLTFDENETATKQNRVLSILLGDAVPDHKLGANDNNYYNHYSGIATCEANWNLHTLGRHDVGANVYDIVADKTRDVLRPWDGPDTFCNYHFNSSYAGVFNTASPKAVYPAPNLAPYTFSHRTVLPKIAQQWADSSAPSYYTDSVYIPDGQHPPQGFEPTH